MRGSLKPGVKQRAETKIYGHKTVVSTLLAITGLLKMGIDIGIEKKSRTLTDVGRSVIFYSVIVLSCILPITAWADQTCKDSIVATTPDANFTINSDGTVTHKTTGLMWMRCSLGQTWDGKTCKDMAAIYTWGEGLRAGTNYEFAGYKDWRLPNKNELESIVEERCYSPAINASVFPETPSAYFWSSSPYAGFSQGAWSVDFGYGSVNASDKDGTIHVRLVRDVE